MTSQATRIRKGDELHERGVNAATVLLHEAKGIMKVAPDPQPSSTLAFAMQCAIIAAVEAGAHPNVALNALCDATGWALATFIGGPGPERFTVFSSMTGDMLARADKHAAATHLGNIEPGGRA